MATSAGQVHVRCRGPELNPAPGQFYLAAADAPGQPFLRQPIFPFFTREHGLEFCVAADHPFAMLEPGTTLDVIGPCGRGFDLPLRAAHLLVMCSAPTRLMSLLHYALERSLSVTVLLPLEALLPDLPLAVEIQRGAFSAELGAWADVIALDVPEPAALARAIRALCPTRPADFVQALITPPMPCGTGACAACWVETGAPHRQLACVAGPVFAL
jgi:hypothetical protein